MNFDFLGNERIVKYFDGLLKRGNFPPSFLFSGREGIGKFYLAKSVVKALNCLNKDGKGLSFCGTCKNCRRIEEESFVDFIVIRPEGNFIKLDQIKDVIAKTNFTPFESDKKIFVIDDADRMNKESANSLLKTLEEPPADVTFFLITSKLNKILPTIKSRCQIFEFSSLNNEDVAKFLSSTKKIPYENALSLAYFFDGSIGKALNFDVKEIKGFQNKVLTFFMESLDNNSPQSFLMELIDELNSNKMSVDEFLKFLLFLLRDIFIVKIGFKEEKLFYFEKLDLILFLSEKIDFSKIFDLFFKIFEFEEKRNLNLKKDLFLLDLFFILEGKG